MADDPIKGHNLRLAARVGNAAQVPALITGELGWDLDKKVGRFGDDSPSPARIPTTKSLGTFDMSMADKYTFSLVNITENGLVDGVDLSLLNAAPGMLVRKTYTNTWGQVMIVSLGSLTTLSITNGDGVIGDIDMRVHPDILNLISADGGFLMEVVSSLTFTGKGTAQLPLDIVNSFVDQVGATRYATDAEAKAGLQASAALTPKNLMALDSGSDLINHFRALFQTTLSITTDQTLGGAGNTVSPLNAVQATLDMRGVTRISTAVEIDAGVSANTSITPAGLKGLTRGSPTAIDLAKALGIGLPLNFTNLVMTGPGILGRTTAGTGQVTVVPYATRNKVITGSDANDQDVVNQATLKAFFPRGALKIEPMPLASFPPAATVGKGAIAYNSDLDELKASDGFAWRGLDAFMAANAIWRPISRTDYSGTGVVTIPMVPQDLLYITITGGGGLITRVQANIDGSWVPLTDEPVVDDDTRIHIARPNGRELHVLYAVMDPGQFNFAFNGFILVQKLGAGGFWNGQLRGQASNTQYRVWKYRQYAIDIF